MTAESEGGDPSQPEINADMTEAPANAASNAKDKTAAFAKGLLRVFSPSWLVLFMSFVGFGALASQAGFTLAQSVFTTLGVFALPGQIVLTDQVIHGGSLLSAAFAVALTAIRLMPLTASLMPYLRDDSTPKWAYFPLSHYVAVTVWAETMRHVPGLPLQLRIPRFLGFAVAFSLAALTGTLVGYQAAAIVPPIIKAALLFLSPVYFLLSLIIVATGRMDNAAIVIGAFLGPVFFLLFPGFDLLATGLVGGTLAYGGARWIWPQQ